VVALSWGSGSVATYERGQIVDVSWCLRRNADHGGVYAFRLCDNPDIVEKFKTDTPLTGSEQLEAEQCFQAGILRCDDVFGQDCGLSPRCDPTWGCA